MANKKKTNKRKHNRKIKQKIVIKNKQQQIKKVDKISDIIKQDEQTIEPKEIKEKGKEKKSSKKYLIISFFFLIGLMIFFILGYDKNINKETKQINLNYLNNIDKKEFDIVTKFIKTNEFQNVNLNRYLNYFYKYNVSIEHTIIIINNNLDSVEYNETIKNIIEHQSFINDNLSRYIDYFNKYQLSIDKTILAVNNNLDKDNIKLDKTTESFMNQKYFISNNLNRYLNYYEKNKNLSFKEIVTRVNSNLDKTFYKDVQSADTSKGDLILVNKFYYLDNDYVPNNLVNISSKHGTGKLKKNVYNAFKEMYNDAKDEGLYLYISSPYRSYNRQKTLYTNYSNKDGSKEADKYSARPGYSEHQTGLSFDLGTASNHSINDFVNSKEFLWMEKNAHKYGFILRYPYGKTYITGYIYEPWHYRYVGVDIATYIYENNITYEEYYAYFIN